MSGRPTARSLTSAAADASAADDGAADSPVADAGATAKTPSSLRRNRGGGGRRAGHPTDGPADVSAPDDESAADDGF